MSKRKVSNEANGNLFEAKLEALSKKIDDLNENLKHFKTVVKDEFQNISSNNALVLEVLGENTVALRNILKMPTSKYKKMFPIKSLDELKNFDANIDENSEKAIISSIKLIIGNRGLKKGLPDIVCPSVLQKCNVDGIHNKVRFLNFKKFCDVLCLASNGEIMAESSFKSELRLAMKAGKNRFFKDKSKTKLQETSTNTFLDDTLPSLFE